MVEGQLPTDGGCFGGTLGKRSPVLLALCESRWDLRFSGSEDIFFFLCVMRARVAELVDALDLESSGIAMRVQLPPLAPETSVRLS